MAYEVSSQNDGITICCNNICQVAEAYFELINSEPKVRRINGKYIFCGGFGPYLGESVNEVLNNLRKAAEKYKTGITIRVVANE